MKRTFSTHEISDYYDQTAVHYRQWLGLKKNMALHYGYWEEGIRKQSDALLNMNRQVLKRIESGRVESFLDAGCGVGGTTLFLAGELGAHGIGISLSEKQVQEARENAKGLGLEKRTEFLVRDFRDTGFPDDSFNLVITMESLVHVADKEKFFQEVKRILKPGGKLLSFEYWCPVQLAGKKLAYLNKWVHKWAMADLWTLDNLKEELAICDFDPVKIEDITDNIRPSSRLMYLMSFPGALTTEVYKLLHKVSRFNLFHYQSVYYQYRALKKGYWKYCITHATKKI